MFQLPCGNDEEPGHCFARRLRRYKSVVPFPEQRDFARINFLAIRTARIIWKPRTVRCKVKMAW
jgi:hypothetical protein